MDRIWQWTWDRYGVRYSWAFCAISFPVVLPVYLFVSFVVVAFEKSGQYVEAAAATVVGVLVGEGKHHDGAAPERQSCYSIPRMLWANCLAEQSP